MDTPSDDAKLFNLFLVDLRILVVEILVTSIIEKHLRYKDGDLRWFIYFICGLCHMQFFGNMRSQTEMIIFLK